MPQAWPCLGHLCPDRAGRRWGCGNAGPYLVLQPADQLSQPVDLPLQSLCLGVWGTCAEPQGSDGAQGTRGHPKVPTALQGRRASPPCCHQDHSSLLQTTSPYQCGGKQPSLTSLETLPMLLGDHPAGGRVAGHGAVIPGVRQTMASLAGVVPATGEHAGHQGGQSWARRAGCETAQGANVGASFLAAQLLLPDPLGSSGAGPMTRQHRFHSRTTRQHHQVWGVGHN